MFLTVVYIAVQMSLVVLLVLLLSYHISVRDFSATKFALEQLFLTHVTWGVFFSNGLSRQDKTDVFCFEAQLDRED